MNSLPKLPTTHNGHGEDGRVFILLKETLTNTTQRLLGKNQNTERETHLKSFREDEGRIQLINLLFCSLLKVNLLSPSELTHGDCRTFPQKFFHRRKVRLHHFYASVLWHWHRFKKNASSCGDGPPACNHTCGEMQGRKWGKARKGQERRKGKGRKGKGRKGKERSNAGLDGIICTVWHIVKKMEFLQPQEEETEETLQCAAFSSTASGGHIARVGE